MEKKGREKKKEKFGEDKGKWNKRGKSKLFGQNARGRSVTVN
jgi:hypothetical protein